MDRATQTTVFTIEQQQVSKEKKKKKAIEYRPLVIIGKFIIFISIIGFLYQFYDITVEYSQKQVLTNTVIKFSRSLVLPDISICSRLTHLVNYSALEEKHPEFVANLRRQLPQINSSRSYSDFVADRDGYKTIFKDIVTNFTLKEIVEFLYSEEDMFIRVHLVSNVHYGSLSPEQFEKQCKWKRYAQELNVCYSLSCSSSSPYTISEETLSKARFKGIMMSFNLRQSVFALIPFLEILIHTPNTFPRGQQSPSEIVNSNSYATLTTISYKRFATSLLPWPYSSDCKDYKSEGFATRLDKIEECQNNLSLKLLNSPYYGNIHSMDSHAKHPYLYYFLEYHNETIQKISDNIFSVCNATAENRNCDEEYYIPKELFPQKYAGDVSFIKLKAPTEPDIILESHEKMSFSQYLILVESLGSCWFGYCIAGSIPMFYGWSKYYRRKFKKYKNVLKTKTYPTTTSSSAL